jgi:hypothetical protein
MPEQAINLEPRFLKKIAQPFQIASISGFFGLKVGSPRAKRVSILRHMPKFSLTISQNVLVWALPIVPEHRGSLWKLKNNCV